MRNKNTRNRGFFLLESLLVVTFVGTFMILTYMQISNLYSFQKGYISKNPIGNIFIVDSFRIYLHDRTNDYERQIADNIDLGIYPYYVITKDTCELSMFTDTNLCQSIFTKYEMRYVIITKYNISDGEDGIDYLSDIKTYNESADNSFPKLPSLVLEHLENASKGNKVYPESLKRVIVYFENDTLGYVRD